MQNKHYLFIACLFFSCFSSCYARPKSDQPVDPNAQLISMRMVQYEYDDSAANEIKVYMQIRVKNNSRDTVFMPNQGGVNLQYKTKSFFFSCIYPKDTIIINQSGAGENRILPFDDSYFNLILPLKSAYYGKVDSLNYKDLAEKITIQYHLVPSDNTFYRGKIRDTLIFDTNYKPTLQILPVNLDPEKASCGCP
ncbi:MAG: hypothetical protein LBR67_08745 [Dysgonamonadaceae bacterium]|jgi:hypothetical protein|nr:hypothetical protein [Dysgonamonadaceae bacterium]